MPRVDLVVETPVSSSPRARQLEGMFDVPYQPTQRVEWHGDVDLDARPWSVGLIVGPSGSGKSTLARELFGAEAVDRTFEWAGASVIDDLAPNEPIDHVTSACQAVGFSTVPAWLRPYRVLSTGEQFRVSLARALLEEADPVVFDEFTSVVDRQVARVASHAVQRYVRREGRRFVAVSCHYDILDWLQPDWVLEPSTMSLDWRHLQPRPQLDVEIARVDHSAWRLFAPFHYLTAELSSAARCYVMWVDGTPAAFAGLLHRPHAQVRNLVAISRIVTLPDWQGLGLAFHLSDTLGAAHAALGYRFRNYPAHPAYIRSHDRSPHWALTKRPGRFAASNRGHTQTVKAGAFGGRPNAVFEYVGPAMADAEAAERLLQVRPYGSAPASGSRAAPDTAPAASPAGRPRRRTRPPAPPRR